MALVLIVPVVLLGLLGCAARSWLLVVRIRGTSMAPTLHPDDRALALRVRPSRRPRAGEVVVCRTPPMVGAGALLVKRVAAVAGDPLPNGGPGARVPTGRVFLVGDGDHSTDSRYFGTLPQRDVVARVLVRLWSSR
jgi:type IV secretory pathway protease TraF